MQCPKCGSFHKYKYGMTCSCRYQFVTDPKVTGFGDKRLKNSIDKLSEGDKYFTQEELYCKCYKPTTFLKSFCVFAIFAAILIIAIFLLKSADHEAFEAFGFSMMYCPGLILVIGLILALARVNKIDTDVIPAVDAYVGRYFPPNLLKTDKIKENSFSQVKYEEFTPDHFLIVDCRETLSQLLTNGFHRDHNCMIMTSDKFPQKAFDYYLSYKKSNPETKLYLFHDASLKGDLIANGLVADASWNTSFEQIVDLGINTKNLISTNKGVWRCGSELAAHRKKEQYIDEKINSNWKYMIDSLPQGRLLALLGFAFTSGYPLLSEEFHQAYLENQPHAGASGVDGGSQYDDFG
ncbi:uncharacterized protein METZ01_LOCUS172453 [marine metagenome]|uniref:Uncharacterized protein n=1 Tax=marine metagenome TaxID=408172 RepID=A0A382C178_9ZZZZ